MTTNPEWAQSPIDPGSSSAGGPLLARVLVRMNLPTGVRRLVFFLLSFVLVGAAASSGRTTALQKPPNPCWMPGYWVSGTRPAAKDCREQAQVSEGSASEAQGGDLAGPPCGLGRLSEKASWALLIQGPQGCGPQAAFTVLASREISEPLLISVVALAGVWMSPSAEGPIAVAWLSCAQCLC